MSDNLTPDQRRKTMRAVKGRDTSLERVVSSALHRLGLRYRRCVTDLPGKPDFVFPKARVVVFLDGSWWHGWRFPLWKHTIGQYWQEKIERNRKRDQKNFRRLRRAGWTVVRFWDHQVQRDLKGVVGRIAALVTGGDQQQQQEKLREEIGSTVLEQPRLQIYRPPFARKRQASRSSKSIQR